VTLVLLVSHTVRRTWIQVPSLLILFYNDPKEGNWATFSSEEKIRAGCGWGESAHGAFGNTLEITHTAHPKTTLLGASDICARNSRL
jgi:hypothetical protein